MRRLTRHALLLSLCASVAFVALGCSDDTASSEDSGTLVDGLDDAPTTDLSSLADSDVDSGPRPDGGAPTEQGVTPDQSTPSEQGVSPDQFVEPDQFVGPAEGVILFGSSSVSAQYALNTVKTDGTNLAAVSGAPSTTIDFTRIDLAGAHGPLPIAYGEPVVSYLYLANADPLWHLRDRARSVVRFNDGTGSGLALIDGASFQLIDGDVDPLAFGVSPSEFYTVAIDPARSTLAAVKHDTQLMLYKLDASTFAGGASSFDAAPLAGVDRIEYTSLLATADRIYFVARKSTSPDVYGLFSAPLDGSASATEISIPPLGGGAVTHVGRFGFALSADGSTIAFTAGTSEEEKGVYVIRSGAAPTLISNEILDYSDRESDFMDGRSPLLAVSAKGSYVAYRDYLQASASSRLFVAKSDGSAVHELSVLANFFLAVREFNNLLFADDENLIFFAGTGSSSTDAYRFAASTQTLSNLTQTATETAAPFGGGELKPEGGWLSRDRQMLWVLDPTGSLGRIWGIDLAAFSAQELSGNTISVSTDGASVRDHFRALPADDRVFFIGTTKPADTVLTDIFTFDGSKTDAPLNLTENAAAVKIEAITPSPDGQWVAFVEDDATLKIVAASGGNSLDLVQGSNIGSYQWLPDSSGVAYTDGPSESTRKLYYVGVGGGSPVTLFDDAGYIAAFGAN